MAIYFARFRVLGKLIRKSLKTDGLNVGKFRLADLEKTEPERASAQANAARGKLSFGEEGEIETGQRADSPVRFLPRDCPNSRNHETRLHPD